MRQVSANEPGTDELLLEGPGGSFTMMPTGWSADGRFIAYTTRGSNVWILPLFGDREPFAFAETPFIEASAVFSPDGRWIAYSTTDTGDRHVYIERLDAPGPRFQVSVRNGREPFWRADGKELYYHGPDRMFMAVSADLSGETPVLGPPRPLFQLQFRGWDVRHHIAPLPDGSAFVMNVPVTGSTPPPLSFVLNWLQP